MSLFATQVEITAYKYNIRSGEKPSALSGQYARAYLKQPSHALSELHDLIINEPKIGFHLSPMTTKMPDHGQLAKGIRVGTNFIPESYVQCIDIDIPKSLSIVTSHEGDILLDEGDDVPKMKSASQLSTWLRRTLGIQASHGVLITYSHSTMAYKKEHDELPDRISAHCYVVFDAPLDTKEFTSALEIRCRKDQWYRGMTATGKLKESHPWADFATNSAKVFNEWTGEDSPVALFRGGEPLSATGWMRTSRVKPNVNEPINIYTETQHEQVRAIHKRFMAEQAANNPHHNATRSYKDGESFEFDEPIYKNNVFICYASEMADKFPKSINVDSKSDPTNQSGHMWYTGVEANLFIDFAHGENTRHGVKPKECRRTINYTGTRYIKDLFESEVKPREHKVSLMIAKPDSGKTYAVLHRDVSMFSPYNGGILLVPTLALAQKVSQEYPHVKHMESGTTKWEELDDYVWGVMTYNKFYGHMMKGSKASGKLVVMDEIHTRLRESSELNRYMADVYQGREDTGAAELLLVTATIEPETLMIEDLPIYKFETDHWTDVYSVRVTPYRELGDADRAFLFMDNKSELGVLTSWLRDMGRRAINLHGKNLITADGLKTNISATIEQDYDFICSTSVMREGYSLTAKYDLVMLNNATAHSAGSQDIAQALMRVRNFEGEAFLKIANTHFREVKKRPNLSVFMNLAKAAFNGTRLDYELIKYFKSDAFITASNFLSEEGVIKIDPLGIISYYNTKVADFEKSSFEGMSDGLARSNINLVDLHSIDNDLSPEEIKIIEAEDRGESNASYLERKENIKTYKKECREAITKKELENLIDNAPDIPELNHFTKKLMSTEYTETVMWDGAPGGTAYLNERHVTLSRASSSFLDTIHRHDRAVVQGIYEKAVEYVTTGVRYNNTQLVRKLDAMLKSNKAYKKENIRKALDLFCEYVMFDREGNPQDKYSGNVVAYEIIRIGLILPEMLIPINRSRPRLKQA